MCNPALALAIASTAIAARGQYVSGKFQEAQAKTNEQIAETQALDATRRGQIAEDEQRARVRQVLGTQRAILAANAVSASTGSPLALLADTARYGELDALTVRNNAAREAYGYRIEGMNARSRGQFARLEGNYGAGSTLLAGGAQAYGIWRNTKA